MRRMICLIIAIVLLLSGCARFGSPSDRPTNPTGDAYTETYSDADSGFRENKSSSIVSTAGIEYAPLAYEGKLYYFGALEFCGGVNGEPKTTPHNVNAPKQTGLFSIKDSKTDNILIRHVPYSEWFLIYRKASLPDFDFSVDNCVRLELVTGESYLNRNPVHANCGEGITDKAEIKRFLADIRSQKSPLEAGLYELIKKQNGTLENCYSYAVIYGFFAEEPDLVICMTITSYNDLAYSVSIEDKEYVLPEAWLQKLQKGN